MCVYVCACVCMCVYVCACVCYIIDGCIQCFNGLICFQAEEIARKQKEERLARKRQSLPPEPSDDTEEICHIMVRLPSGSRVGRKFLNSCTLQVLSFFAVSCWDQPSAAFLFFYIQHVIIPGHREECVQIRHRCSISLALFSILFSIFLPLYFSLTWLLLPVNVHIDFF